MKGDVASWDETDGVRNSDDEASNTYRAAACESYCICTQFTAPPGAFDLTLRPTSLRLVMELYRKYRSDILVLDILPVYGTPILNRRWS